MTPLKTSTLNHNTKLNKLFLSSADLLVVAFDIVLAGCIGPLFAAIYFKKTVRMVPILVNNSDTASASISPLVFNPKFECW